MNVLKVCLNNYKRAVTKKGIFIMAFILIPILIAASIFVSNKTETITHAALVSNSLSSVSSVKNLDIKKLNKEPEFYNLVLGNYDAIVTEKTAGRYDIKSIQSAETRNKLDQFFNNNNRNAFADDKSKRGIGTNSLAYISLLIMMESLLLMTFYPEDRQSGTFRRILTSGTRASSYLLSQCIFNFILLFVPSFIAAAITHFLLGQKTGLPFSLFTLMLAVICLLSSALSLLLTSSIQDEDNCISFASGLIMFLALASGAIIPLTTANKFINTVTDIIPLKTFLSVSQKMENGSGLTAHPYQILYILIWAAVLYIIGSMVTKRKMSEGIY